MAKADMWIWDMAGASGSEAGWRWRGMILFYPGGVFSWFLGGGKGGLFGGDVLVFFGLED